MIVLFFFIYVTQAAATTVKYNAYYGCPASKQDILRYEELNNTFWCLDEISLPCDPKEGRRIDGTCNNLKYPIRGAARTPFARVLPADFGPDFGPKKSKSGKPPRSARELRTALLAEGDIPSQVFTHLMTYILVFLYTDFVTIQDSVNFVLWKPYCCEEKGKSDDMCAPISIPDDDPVLRFSSIRCLNQTKPMTYQNQGCLRNPNSTTPSRLTASTPFLDINQLYGTGDNINKARTFQGGMLKYEVEEGRIWPPSLKDSQICAVNEPPRETRCHDTPDVGANILLGNNLMTIWFWRLHNHIASELALVNPCWNDEKLFIHARDINIAIMSQIVYYEAFPSLVGWNNLVRDGVISNCPGFRDEYDENIVPQTYLEFPFIGRWVHTMQPGKVQMYDTQGNYLKDYPEINLTARTGFLAVDNNMDYITQGAFRQPSANINYVVDNLIAEVGLGKIQEAVDITSNDLAKNRHSGFPSYIKYRDFCSGTSHTKFDDLADYMDLTMLELLKNNYEDVEDVELLSGVWMERPMNGGYVPPTFYCLITTQLRRLVQYDRHWYERPNRPNAFTYDQLLEIRKATIAQFMCTVGDKVTEIQPQAFYRAGPENQMTSCNNIPKINFEAWRDAQCSETC